MKKVFVYPCGTEIALEIYRSVNNSIHYELFGGSSSYDHGRFVYKNHIENLPFISDSSDEKEIILFEKSIEKYNFDYIYPAMDGVIYKFAQYRHLFKETVIVPDFLTASITRSKRKTYDVLKNTVKTPQIYHDKSLKYPVFIKPDVGQGSCGTHIINNEKELDFYYRKDSDLVLEYLPGKEYTIDCFTNSDGKLIFAQPRTRQRIKSGISVNSRIVDDEKRFIEPAKKINSLIKQKGAWFFQLKENNDNELVLLEVASRIAGSSELARINGINLALMTLHLFDGQKIDSVINNKICNEFDRALSNKYLINCSYNKVYIDFDDTIIVNNEVNTDIIKFIYQSVNEGCDIILISKHNGNLTESLIKYKLQNLFSKVIHINNHDEKYKYIEKENSIFIDDSYNERLSVKENLGISVFSPQEIECLINKG